MVRRIVKGTQGLRQRANDFDRTDSAGYTIRQSRGYTLVMEIRGPGMFCMSVLTNKKGIVCA
jgi:hypothetical protein